MTDRTHRPRIFLTLALLWAGCFVEDPPGSTATPGGSPTAPVVVDPTPPDPTPERTQPPAPTPTAGPTDVATATPPGTPTPVGTTPSPTPFVPATATPRPQDVPAVVATGSLDECGLTEVPGAISICPGSELTARFTFRVTNFTLKAEGTCEEIDAPCGQVALTIDGEDGNLPGQSWNVIGDSSPLTADFSRLPAPEGLHTVGLRLLFETGTPDGEAPSDALDVVVNLTPTLRITPFQVEVPITGGADSRVAVPFEVGGYRLAAPGTCGGEGRCGHVEVQVDGELGNAPGKDHNNTASSSPATALLGGLAEPVGVHTVRLTLVDDDGAPVLADGAPISDEVEVTTRLPDIRLEIVEPTDETMAVMATNQLGEVPIFFALQDFTLVEPEVTSCDLETSSLCGSLVVEIDGAQGNEPGQEFNAFALASPASAYFAYLPEPAGHHTVTLRLLHPDGAPVLDTQGDPLVRSVDLTTTLPGEPFVELTSPRSGATVTLGTDTRLSLPVDYNAVGLQDVDGDVTFEGLEMQLYVCPITGEVGGGLTPCEGGAPNAQAPAQATGTLTAHFDVFGEVDQQGFVLTLVLVDDQGEPLRVEGAPVRASIEIVAELGEPAIQIVGYTDGDHVVADLEGKVYIPYLLEGFVGREPGLCSGDEPQACGYIDVTLNGAQVAQTGFNPAPVPITPFKMGTYTLDLRLSYNNGSPVFDDDGARVHDVVTLVVQEPGTPFVTIVSPAEGGTVGLRGEELLIPVVFSAAFFDVIPPGGACDAQSTGIPCGPVAYTLAREGEEVQRGLWPPDEDALSWALNPDGSSFTFSLPVEDLVDPEGEYDLTLQLIDQATGEVVEVAEGVVAEADVAFFAELAVLDAAPDVPTLVVTSPQEFNSNPAQVTLSGLQTLPVFFTGYSVDLQDPATCITVTEPCGQVALTVDGAEGNLPGLSYNALGFTSPLVANFLLLEEAAGLHTVTLTLVDAQARPILWEGAPIETSVRVEVNTDPSLDIALTEGVPIRAGNDSQRTIDVPFVVSNFTLKAPGTCSGAPRCGHIGVKIDGNAGDAPGLGWNNLAWTNPAEGYLAGLDPVAGEHLVTLALLNDQGQPLSNPGSADQVHVDVQEVIPGMVVLYPVSGAQVVVNPSENYRVPLTLSTPNFTLAPPGECPPEELPDCGYATITVDGSDGNAPNVDYNALATQPAAVAQLGYLDQPTGQHRISLTLRRNDGSLVLAANKTVTAHVDVTATTPGEPYARILTPNGTAPVTLGSDPELTVPVTYAVAGFTLAPPGTCGGASNCGQLRLGLDGDEGNQPGAPYHALAWGESGSAVEAHFAALADPVGLHTLSVSLQYDGGAPYLYQGEPLVVSVTVETVPGVPSIDIVGVTDDDLVRVDAQALSFPLGYVTRSFVVAEPGSCDPAQLNLCGQVEVLIDGQVASETWENPAQVRFDDLDEALGFHEFTLRLVDEGGVPIRVDGMTIEDHVTLQVELSSDPWVRIVSPVEGQQVVPRGEDQLVAVNVAVDNFAYQTDEQGCLSQGEEAPVCGYVVLKIDGDAGNLPARNYNAISNTPGPLWASFEVFSDPVGEHTLTVMLTEGPTSGEPILLSSGEPAQTQVKVVVVSDRDTP